MAINDIITKIYDTKWDYANQFDLYITLPKGVSKIQSLKTTTRSAVDLKLLDNHDTLNTAVKTFTVPDYTTQPIETYVGGAWAYTTGIKELQKVDVTLRDFDEFYLYRAMTYILDGTKDMFPADQYWTLRVRTKKEGVVVFETSVAILDAVSNISFDRTNESQIAEFTVSFKTR